jgi:hypothetical protein
VFPLLLGTGFLVALASCGDSGTAERAAPNGERITSLPSSNAAWETYKRESGKVEIESAPEGQGDGAVRVLARTESARRLVDVAEFDGTAWKTVAEVVLPPPDYDFGAGGQRVQVGDVTRDGHPDFLVPLEAAQPIGVVISDDGGAWRDLPVIGRDGSASDPYLGLSPRFDGGELVSDDRLCEPSCADGDTRTITWRYVDGALAAGQG